METAQGAFGGISSVRLTVEEKCGKKEDFGPFQKKVSPFAQLFCLCFNLSICPSAVSGPSLAVKPTGAPVRVGDKEGQGHTEELTSYFMSHTPAPLLHLQPQHVLQPPRPHGQLHIWPFSGLRQEVVGLL